MKRYDIVDWQGDHQGAFLFRANETPIGQFVTYTDLQAWALKLKATVEKVEHNSDCESKFCAVCGWNNSIGHRPDPEDSTFHPATPRQCNCPRGDLLRDIEEVCGGR